VIVAVDPEDMVSEWRPRDQAWCRWLRRQRVFFQRAPL